MTLPKTAPIPRGGFRYGQIYSLSHNNHIFFDNERREMLISKKDKIGVLCLPSPENSLFTAMAYNILRKILLLNGMEVAEIWAISGSVTTALMGSIREEERLCKIWYKLKPEDIVGHLNLSEADGISQKVDTFRTITKALWSTMRKKESILTGKELRSFMERVCDIDKVFSPGAIPIVVVATDFKTGEPVFFTNQIPEHKDIFWSGGVMGSMGVAPWFPPVKVLNPHAYKLSDDPGQKELHLFDGGYSAGLPLIKMMHDSRDFDVIFIIDIHNLEIMRVDAKDTVYSWQENIERAKHILRLSRDRRIFLDIQRVDEELEVRDQLINVSNGLPKTQREELEPLIARMNHGRLDLAGKKRVRRFVISSNEDVIFFNFRQFTQAEKNWLLTAGAKASLKVCRSLGLWPVNKSRTD